MGVTAFGSLPPQLRRTVSGRVFLQAGEAAAAAAANSQQAAAAAARATALLDGQTPAGAPLAAPAGHALQRRRHAGTASARSTLTRRWPPPCPPCAAHCRCQGRRALLALAHFHGLAAHAVRAQRRQVS